MHCRPRRNQLLSLAVATSLLLGTAARAQIRAHVNERGAAEQAQAALDAGRAALRRNHADESLPQLQTALTLFTQTNDPVGAAAARDQIGDIYQRYGQYQTALDNYQPAYEAFCGARQQANANLLLVKIGETRYLAGDAEGARQSLALMNQCGGAGGSNVAAGGDGDRRREGGAAFLPVGAAISLASCPAFSSNDDDNANNQPNEPTQGHGPTNGRSPSVRMDLRVFDQDGNPVKGVKAKLESERAPNGFLCECTHITDAAGKVLMDPIHLTHTLKLTLSAKGFDPLQVSVDPSDLNQPYQVAIHAKAAAAGANAAGHVSNAARQARNANPAACFDLYSLFASYVFGELRLGRADYEAGNTDAARTHYQNVLAVSDDGSPAGKLELARLFRAVARTNLGDVALREGRFADAARLYRQAIDGAQKDNRPELVWAAERGLGKSLWSLAQQNDPNAAREREDALDAFRAAIKTVETLFAGSLRADEARANFLASTRDLFDDAASAFAESAFAESAHAAPSAAGDAPSASATEYAPTTARVRQSLAHAAHDPSGQTTQRQATQRQPAARQPAARQPETRQPAAPVASRPQNASASQALTGRALAYAAEAFRVTEEGRARALLDLIGEARAEISEGVPADLIARRAENAARQQEIDDALRGVRAATAAPPQDSVAKLEAELSRLATEYDAIENQIRVASPRYNSLVRSQPLSLAEVQQQVLDDQTALLEYSLGRERSYLFAVTRAGLALYRLPPRAAVEAQVFELRKQLVPAGARRAIAGIDTGDEAQRGVEEDLKAAASGRGLVLGGPAVAAQVVKAYAAAASALYDTAVAPAAQLVDGKRLLVVADGALNFVPFEALVTRASGDDYAALPYLVKTNEIVYAPSASVVAALRAARAASAQGQTARGVLVVADPVFDPADARAKGKNISPRDETAQRAALKSAVGDVANLKGTRLRLVRLAGTRSEAEQIAALARTAGDAPDLWLDFDASESNLRRHQLEGYGVIHFATHGLLDTDRPQFTGLALSLVGDSDTDGFLRVGEVFNLRLGSPLVVLSACETGLGKENRGEGVIGLARAFMYAGAPSVAVSLWSVADRSTAELMPDFYKRYLAAGGHAPAAALRAAQQQMIAGKRYSAPFYWAPFVLVGDWK